MSKEGCIRLTLGVYKVSELFPEKEPLKREIRKLANEILASLLCNNYKGLAENIKLIQNLLDLAESRGLADPRNFSVLRREYAKIGDICVENLGKTVLSGEKSSKNVKNKKRQEVIFNLLKTNGKVKISDLRKSFPSINRRTILRDLGIFCQLGVAERSGNGRGACYTIKNATF